MNDEQIGAEERVDDDVEAHRIKLIRGDEDASDDGDDVEAHRIKLIRGDEDASDDDVEGHRIKLIRGGQDDKPAE